MRIHSLISFAATLALAVSSLSAEIACKPTFVSCGYYFTPDKPLADRDSLRVEFRPAGDASASWRDALAPFWFQQDSQFRGSIVDLAENTPYELRVLVRDGAVLESTTFRTWSSDVPIGQSIDIATRIDDGSIVIKDKGTPQSWIRFTAKPGTVIDLDQSKLPSKAGIDITNAEYIILDGLVIRGGPHHAINITSSRHVRIQNCDIAGFGAVGHMNPDPRIYYAPDNQILNYHAGIRVIASTGTVVERCFIHDPRSPSTGWRYAHALGANAMYVDKLDSTVVRWNNFVGTNERRWNDVIEGGGNYLPTGGFQQDADIYGNYLAFQNDDCIELDGGQVNVRLFNNKLEGGYCQFSVNGVVRGPSYVFRNLMLHGGDTDGITGVAFKDFGERLTGGPVVYANNTLFTNGAAFANPSDRRLGRNNVLVAAGWPYRVKQDDQSNFDYDLVWSRRGVEADPQTLRSNTLTIQPQFMDESRGLFALRPQTPGAGDGARVPNFAEPDATGHVFRGAIAPGTQDAHPLRPLGFTLNRAQIIFSPSAPQTEIITLTSTHFRGSLAIRKNDSFAWFTVSPDHAHIEPGQSVTFSVQLNPAHMPYVGSYPGALLIARDDGLAAPVSVYAWKAGPEQEVLQLDSRAVALDVLKPNVGKPLIVDQPGALTGKAVKLDPERCETLTWNFTVPADGDYYILPHVYTPYPLDQLRRMAMGLDGAEPAIYKFYYQLTPDRWQWIGFGNIGSETKPATWPPTTFGRYRLTAGNHTLTLKPVKPLLIDRLVITPQFDLLPGHVNNFSNIPVAPNPDPSRPESVERSRVGGQTNNQSPNTRH